MSDTWRLLVDVGGTNVRFGHSRHGQDIAGTRVWPVHTFDSFETALRAYLATLDGRMRFSSVAIAAAGPATSEAISLTNNDWSIAASDVSDILGYEVPIRLLNDLEAVAYALPYLPTDQVDWIDSVRASGGLTLRKLAVNVGTGFGSAAIIGTSGNWVCCPAESGHMYLSICDGGGPALQSAPGRDCNATVEDILSGGGVRRLWKTVSAAKTSSNAAAPLTDREFDFASTDPIAIETFSIFTTILARAAANLVLAAAAWNGVYLCGSVAVAWAKHADFLSFRQTFTGTGKMRDRLSQTPVGIIRHDLPAFIGLANLDVPPH